MRARRCSVLVAISATAFALLSGTVADAAADTTVVRKSGDQLVVTASTGVGNDITVRRQGNAIVVVDVAAVTAVAPCTPTPNGGVSCPVPITAVLVETGDGDDRVTISPNVDVPSTMRVGAGDDRVVGGPGDDRLIGDDVDAFGIAATPGNDTLVGGPGNDTISGLAGNDTISGDAGNDTLNGDDGNDTLNGEAGNDTLNGGNGNDSANGGPGNDSVTGGAGTDNLVGDSGTDSLNAVDGLRDFLDGGVSIDLCSFDGGGLDVVAACP